MMVWMIVVVTVVDSRSVVARGQTEFVPEAAEIVVKVMVASVEESVVALIELLGVLATIPLAEAV